MMTEIREPWASWPERARVLARIRDLSYSVGRPVNLREISGYPLGTLEMIASQLEEQDHWGAINEEMSENGASN